MHESMKGKVVLITGANGGIGLASAEALDARRDQILDRLRVRDVAGLELGRRTAGGEGFRELSAALLV